MVPFPGSRSCSRDGRSAPAVRGARSGGAAEVTARRLALNYVMLPVPEEYEQEFMQEILKMTLRGPLGSWDEDKLRLLVDDLGPTARRLIALLSHASVRREQRTRRQLTAELDLDIPELDRLADEVNAQCTARGVPSLVLVAPDEDGSDDPAAEVLLVTNTAAEILHAMRDDAGAPALPVG